MKKTIISLHGSYFGNNYGDILLINMFARWINEICPDCVINLPLANRKKTKDLPGGITGLLNLFRSKCLIFCGGGYFGEQPQGKELWAIRNFLRHGIIGLLSIIFKIPYAIIGVEFGPISMSWFRRICILIAKHAEVLVVRNIESKEFLEKYGMHNVILSADAVLSLSEIIRPVKDRNKKEVLLHVPNIYKNYKIIEPLISLISTSRNNYTIGLIHDSFESVYENSEYHQLFEMFEKSGVKYKVYSYQGYNQLISQINNASFVVTTKLHVGITAAALNIRPFSLWLHNKTPRLYNQIGNVEFCHSIYDTGNLHTAYCNYLEKATDFHLSAEIKNLALTNKKFLKDFLDSHKM